MKTKSFGQKLLIGMNVITALNGLLADWNRTHLFNPYWPSHAKFHDAMGLSLGAMLGGAGIFAATRHGGDPKENMRIAALCPAAFFASMASAQAYPNADTIETEFPNYWPKIGKFSFNELPFALTMLAVTAIAWRLAETGKLLR
ncbi:MAG: hypothetical protein QM790_15395 [Nibricoccus sp.]